MSYESPQNEINKTPEKQVIIQKILDSEAESLIEEMAANDDVLNAYYGGRLNGKNQVIEEKTKKSDESIEIIETTKNQLRALFQDLLKKEIIKVLELYPNWNIDLMLSNKYEDAGAKAEQQSANQEFTIRLKLLRLSFNAVASPDRNSAIFNGNTEEERIKNIKGFVANETGKDYNSNSVGNDEKMREYLQISDDGKAETAEIFRKNYPGNGY